MKYKLIVTDYDSTVLNSKHTISDYTRNIIAEYRRRGGIFTISTGRMHASIIEYCIPDLGLSGNIPVISYQGALIRESETGKTISFKPMPFGVATASLYELDSRGLYVQFYFGDEIACNRDCEYRRGYLEITGNEPIIVKDFKGFAEQNTAGIIKILTVAEPEAITSARDYILSNQQGIRAERTSPYMMEIYDAEAGKGNALKILAEHLGIPRQSVMAFGDSDNDISMIEYAGMGVAVDNGSAQIKAVADAIAQSCDDDGVAKFIEEHILNGKA